MEIQVGMRVRRILDRFMNMGVGDIGTVVAVSDTAIDLLEYGDGHAHRKLEIVIEEGTESSNYPIF
jgi:hypothetical protein